MKSSDKYHLQADDSQFEIFDWEDYRICLFSQKNLDKSNKNEDCSFFYSSENAGVLGVCDGVGGQPMGQEAANIAAKCITNAFNKNNASDIIFLNILEQANSEIRDLKVGASTTVCFASLINDYIRFYSVGDSEVIHVNNRGSVIYANIAQSPVGYGVEAGLISEVGSLDAPNRNIVSNLLGDEILRYEASSKIDFKKGHSVFIATDGVFDNIEKNNIIDLMSNGQFDECAQELKNACVALKQSQAWRKDDDISFVYIRRVRA